MCIVTNQHSVNLDVGIINDSIQCLQQYKLDAVCTHCLEKIVFLQHSQDTMAAIERKKKLNRITRLEKLSTD